MSGLLPRNSGKRFEEAARPFFYPWDVCAVVLTGAIVLAGAVVLWRVRNMVFFEFRMFIFAVIGLRCGGRNLVGAE